MIKLPVDNFIVCSASSLFGPLISDGLSGAMTLSGGMRLNENNNIRLLRFSL